jgi:GNAT superfamily N-acetyltransferase
MDISIRRAILSEAPLIADYNRRLAQETEGLRLDPACVQAGVTALLKDPAKGVYFVAEVNQAVVGQLMITYEWSDWRNGNLWWIQSVYVSEQFRGSGVFRALFNHVFNLANAQPEVTGLRLYMDAHNSRARQAYERLGLKHTNYEVFEMALPKRTDGRVE